MDPPRHSASDTPNPAGQRGLTRRPTEADSQTPTYHGPEPSLSPRRQAGPMAPTANQPSPSSKSKNLNGKPPQQATPRWEAFHTSHKNTHHSTPSRLFGPSKKSSGVTPGSCAIRTISSAEKRLRPEIFREIAGLEMRKESARSLCVNPSATRRILILWLNLIDSSINSL